MAGDQKSGLGVWCWFVGSTNFLAQWPHASHFVNFVAWDDKSTLIGTWMYGIIAAGFLPVNTRDRALYHFSVTSLPHLIRSLTISEASSLEAWKPLSPGPSPLSPQPLCHHMGLLCLFHSTQVVALPLSLPSLQLVTSCRTCSSPSWPSFALDTPCYSYLHTCHTSLRR